MASVFDVARYILEKQGKMSTMKLQKLCYYSQAWSLVWDDQPLFDEEFRAWANGPVCRELFRETQGQFAAVAADEKKGDSGRLTANQKDTIDKVLEIYVPDETIKERVSGRRVCEGCGASYHIKYKPTKVEGVCDKCGAATVIRKDDKPETVQKRLTVYHNQTQPLIDYYKGQNILKTVDGTQPMEKVFADIVAILGE